MKTLIVYDSFFGNTEQIARSMGAALDSLGDVEMCRVGDVRADGLRGIHLLIVGSPTRGFRPSPAVTEFLKAIPSGSLAGVKVAAFDTRIATSDIKTPILRALVNLGGYAAPRIADGLRKQGGELVMPLEGFYVVDREGPLKPGELERAGEWAKQCAQVSELH